MESLYTPILKGRGGEFEALAHLTRSTATKIAPLIEAVPKAQAPDLDATDFVRKLRDHWPLGEAAFVDLNYFVGSSDQPNRWEKLLAEARQYQVKVVPVVHFGDATDVLDQLRAAIETDLRGCCCG